MAMALSPGTNFNMTPEEEAAHAETERQIALINAEIAKVYKTFLTHVLIEGSGTVGYTYDSVRMAMEKMAETIFVHQKKVVALQQEIKLLKQKKN